MGSQQNEWSTEWPTEPGWYWVAESGATTLAVVNVLEARGCGTTAADSRMYHGETRLYADDLFVPVFLRIDTPDLDGAQQALRSEG